jgi:hypothetical protein
MIKSELTFMYLFYLLNSFCVFSICKSRQVDRMFSIDLENKCIVFFLLLLLTESCLCLPSLNSGLRISNRIKILP